MIFESVTIHNLFSYRNAHFSFPTASPAGRNVILIHGRNGYGKTSFINSLKLLFLGFDPELTHKVHAGWKLKPHEYLLGTGDNWEGIFNRRARASGERDCSITLRWRETLGAVTVTRRWELDNHTAFREHLDIQPEFAVDDDELNDDEKRQEFLERRLPKALLPFFIYDAEQVQRLAEANEEGLLEQIERLLDITALNTAEEYLNKVLAKFRRSGAARTAQLQLDELQTKLQLLQQEHDRNLSKKEEMENEIRNIKRQIADIDRKLARAREMSLQSRETELQKKRIKIRTDLEKQCVDLLQRFPSVAPLLVNPELARRAVDRLQSIQQQGRSQLAEELQAILERLPVRLFDEPQLPRRKLDEEHYRFFKQKLNKLIETEIAISDADRPTNAWQIRSSNIAELETMLRDFVSANFERDNIARSLNDISHLRRMEAEITNELNDFSSLSDEDRQRFTDRQAEKSNLEEAINKLNREIGQIDSRIQNINTEEGKIKTDIIAQGRIVVETSRNQIRADIGQRAIETIDAYRQNIRNARRKEIESTVNACFLELMQSHTLISSIKFRDDFRYYYLDNDENTIGTANISAGMKQLTAQAMLWAFTKVTSYECPVVIDTPLARIDRDHQNNLISNYYPKAGNQVLVLPTDSELDINKYKLLLPHIAAEFKLSNPTGDATLSEPGIPMYSA